MKKKALFMIIAAGILWGTSGIFVHNLSPFGITAVQMTTIRASVSFLVMVIFALISDRQIFRVKLKDLWVFPALGISLFFTAFFYYQAMQLTSISTAVVLLYTDPIFVVTVSALCFKEKFSGTKVIAIAGMLIGGALVSGLVGGMQFDTVGVLLGIGSAVLYAIYNIVTKIAMIRGVRPESSTLYSFLCMTVLGMCICKPSGIFAAAAADPFPVIPLMIGIGIVTFVIPYSLYTLSMKELPAGTVSALAIMEPLSGTVFGIVLYHEEMTVFSVIGIVLILASVILIGRDTNK